MDTEDLKAFKNYLKTLKTRFSYNLNIRLFMTKKIIIFMIIDIGMYISTQKVYLNYHRAAI